IEILNVEKICSIPDSIFFFTRRFLVFVLRAIVYHYIPFSYFLVPASARFVPLRVRELFFVFCPRTGKLRRCLNPRYDPISVKRLTFRDTSRRKSPSIV